MKTSQIIKEFTLIPIELQEIARDFERDMVAGLNGESSSLKMLPSFLDIPDGSESGRYLAVDFGGSNVRVIELDISNRKWEMTKRVTFSLRDGAKDFTSSKMKAQELFDFIALHVKDMVEPNVQYCLGHTFSFPCRQEGVKTSFLINWTKEFATKGVEGKDIGVLLTDALARNGVTNVENNVILNDTVGTLLTAAMSDSTADIGSICGTGHNTCYRELHHPLTGRAMIVNMESGNFDKLNPNHFDMLLDKSSSTPGTQMLEKMVSGHYLGMLASIVISEFIGQKIVLSSADLSAVIEVGAAALWENLAAQNIRPEDTVVHDAAEIIKAICKRSAQLVGATFAGVIKHVDPECANKHTVAIDGTLYERMPEYPDNILEALLEILPAAKGKARTVLSKDGSGVGAAVAAAAVHGA